MTRHRSLRQRQRALRRPRALLLPNHLQNLAILNRLFAVGQRHELAIHRVQFAALECEAQLFATQSESMTAGMLPQHQARAGNSHRLGRHDLVRARVLDDTVLVDSCFMCEGIASHNRLVGLH